MLACRIASATSPVEKCNIICLIVTCVARVQNRFWFEKRAKDTSKDIFNLEDVDDVDVESFCGEFKFLSDECVEVSCSPLYLYC